MNIELITAFREAKKLKSLAVSFAVLQKEPVGLILAGHKRLCLFYFSET
jgi:hypothetical protein